ncbi:hypothetical protein TNCV_383431 [Trichonephila clavipes]|nr:hypothetical protein TNCV_383431 [Trichonephila clavipes]
MEIAQDNKKAHFWLNGYVNKQNCRIWSEANPQVYVETPLHPEKLTVWYALWAGGIIGPYFFKNDEGHNVTVNDDRYRAMITNFFILELNNHDVQELDIMSEGLLVEIYITDSTTRIIHGQYDSHHSQPVRLASFTSSSTRIIHGQYDSHHSQPVRLASFTASTTRIIHSQYDSHHSQPVRLALFTASMTRVIHSQYESRHSHPVRLASFTVSTTSIIHIQFNLDHSQAVRLASFTAS